MSLVTTASPIVATAKKNARKPAPPAPKAKATKAPKVVHESTKANPVALVWAYVAKHHAKLGRAECVRQLEKMGIATHTAKTQYQRCHSADYPADRAKWLAKQKAKA